jgi:hypothetical protein
MCLKVEFGFKIDLGTLITKIKHYACATTISTATSENITATNTVVEPLFP